MGTCAKSQLESQHLFCWVSQTEILIAKVQGEEENAKQIINQRFSANSGDARR